MVVIHLVSERQRSGRPRYAADLCHRLRGDGINVIAITRGVREVDALFSDSGIEIHHLPFGGGWDIITPLGLARLLRHIPDREVIIHTYSFSDAKTAARARSLADGPHEKNIRIICECPGVPAGKRVHSFPKDDIPDLFISHGSIAQESITSLLGKDTPPVRIIPLSADCTPNDCTPNENRVREKDSDAGNCLQLLFIGYISPRKGLDTLLEALGKMKHRNFTLTVCGVGNARDVAPLLKSVKRLGIKDQVKWEGEVDNPVEFIHKADLMVIPYANQDTFSHAIALAADCALPVITTAGGDRGGRIKHGVNGIIVPPGDPERLAGEIDRLIDQPETLDTLRKGADASAGAFSSRFADIVGAYRSLSN